MVPNQTYKKLKNMIYEGRLQPGQRLVEVRLSKELSISRIPLRECLIRLESEGLVRRVPNSATFVEDFQPVDILEMYSMRLTLEPLAARLAALQPKPSLVDTLYQLCDQMSENTKKKDWEKLHRTDYEFHYTIVKASHHQRLIRSYENCHIRVTCFSGGSANPKSKSPDVTAQEHLGIVSGIERGDSERAERATREHVSKALDAITEHLGICLDDLPKLRDSASDLA